MEGKHGKALQLSGENNFNTKVGGGFRRYDPFTISLWIKTPDLKERAVVWHRSRAASDAGSRGYELLLESGKVTASLIHFWPGNALSIRTQHTLPLNTWVQITVTYDGSSRAEGLAIYWDGQPIDTHVVRDNLTRGVVYSGREAKEAHKFVVGQRFRDRGFIGGQVDELKIFDRELSAGEVASLFVEKGYFQKLASKASALTEPEFEQLYEYYLRNLDDQYAAAMGALKHARKAYAEAYEAVPEIMVMREMHDPRHAFLLDRGAYDAPAERVERRTPDWLPPMSEDWPRNRLGLAKWVTQPSHPLTARVAVNRFWQMLFGHALVATPLDFGSQGSRPSHPELLDWLARDFVDSGWDVKRLVRQMVTSATFRQSSECPPQQRAADPQNTLLARGPSYRLPAEMIRDSALAASGLLVDKRGGPPVKPYQPAGLWEEKGGGTFTRDEGEGSRRRSLYTYWKRTSPPPGMMILDCPDREVGVAERQVTSTPLQPLLLLNDPQFVEVARALAQSAMTEGGDTLDVQLANAFKRSVSRDPSEQELAILRRAYQEHYEQFAAEPDRAKQFLSIGDHQANDELEVERLAAFTCVAEMILNLHEALAIQ